MEDTHQTAAQASQAGARVAPPPVAEQSPPSGFLVRHGWLVLWIAFCFFAIDGFEVFSRLDKIGVNVQGSRTWLEHAKQAVFLFPHVLAIVALLSCLAMRRRLAVPLLVVLLLLCVIDLSALLVMGHPASLSNIAMINSAVNHASEAVEEHLNAVAAALALNVALFLPLLVAVLRRRHRSAAPGPGVFLLSTTAMLALYAGLLVTKGEDVLIGFPRGFAYGFGTLSLNVNDLLSRADPPPTLVAEGDGVRLARKIVVIVDESIAHAEFRHLMPRTETVVDYGRAFAGANCSAASNYIIRKGGWTRGEKVGRVQVSAVESLFSLARRAGYKTVYVDNQRVLRDPSTKNYIDREELAAIDLVLETNAVQYRRDAESLDRLKALIDRDTGSLRDEAVFVLINKAGTHFPYRNSLSPADRTNDRLTNYRRSITLNSQRYLERLSAFIDEDTLVFYTSDHGQDFGARNTHCMAGDEVSRAEYAVPLLVVTRNPALRTRLRQQRETFVDRLTHLEFSESVRNAMGYSVAGVDSILKEPGGRLNQAFCGLWGSPVPIFGVLPRCVVLDPDDPHRPS